MNIAFDQTNLLGMTNKLILNKYQVGAYLFWLISQFIS